MLKTTFCKYWTIKISAVSMKVKQNDTGAMTTAKHEVFIGLQYENYLAGVMKLWWRGGGANVWLAEGGLL